MKSLSSVGGGAPMGDSFAQGSYGGLEGTEAALETCTALAVLAINPWGWEEGQCQVVTHAGSQSLATQADQLFLCGSSSRLVMDPLWRFAMAMVTSCMCASTVPRRPA